MAQITPRVDIAFKKIFGVEENKDLLISLINSIVGFNDQVTDITLLNPYNAKNFKQDKLSILDIKAVGIDGKRFNIEIQISDEANTLKKAEDKGMAKGMAKGKIEEKINTLLQIIKHKFPHASLTEITTIKNKLQNANKQQLDLWLPDILKATSIKDIGCN